MGSAGAAPGQTPPDDPFQRSVRHKIEQIRSAQDSGFLDPAWAAEDILAFVSQIATSWTGQSDLLPEDGQRAAFLAARRAAIITAVQRLFPAATRSDR